MKKFFSREDAIKFLEGKGLPTKITLNNESIGSFILIIRYQLNNPLFKKSFEKNKKKEEKKLKKLQESLGINSDNESYYESSEPDDFCCYYVDSDEYGFGFGINDSGFSPF
ncbi:unnamed protein product [Oikopleura dioica]|uniref:Uncharacterized protein n=1 Tax=Oikopleura dioica TaxID=34765 RepID=E4XGY8_OIKDI|nr:unnamed protein product [Oikopleura dioica]